MAILSDSPLIFNGFDFFDFSKMSEFFSGTSGSRIRVKIGSFTEQCSQSMPIKFGANRINNG